MHVADVGQKGLAPFIRTCCLEHPCANCIPPISLSSCVWFFFFFFPERPAATFGLENSTSFASFTLSDSLGENFNISFFIRSRKPNGLLMQISNETHPCLTMYLKDGELKIEMVSTDTVTFPGNLVDGERYLVALSFQGGIVGAHQSDTYLELGQLVARPLLAGYEVYVGGHPNPDSVDVWGGYFKGCLQDIQLNSHRIQFFQVENYSLPQELSGTQSGSLVNGCISDDTCKVRCLLGVSAYVQFVIVLWLQNSLTVADAGKLRRFVRIEGDVARYAPTSLNTTHII